MRFFLHSSSEEARARDQIFQPSPVSFSSAGISRSGAAAQRIQKRISSVFPCYLSVSARQIFILA